MKSGSIKTSEKMEDSNFIENLLLSFPEHIFWMDKSCRIVGCNDKQAQTFGFKSGKELLGMDIYGVGKLLGWNKSVCDAIHENDLKVMNSNHPLLVEEKVILNNEEHYFLSHKKPLYEIPSKKVIGLMGVAFDITTRKKAEKELEIAKDKAEAANKAKSNFLAVVSHELRTPLTGILGIIDILNHEKLSPAERAKYLGHINTASKHLLSMINNVLDFTKLEENKVRLHPTSFDVQVILKKAMDIMSGTAEKKGIQLIFEAPKSFPRFLVGDPNALSQILLNIISNALKFTEKGFVKASLELITQTKTVARFRIVIEDTGIGIPKDKLEKIFERFEQVDSSNTRAYGGSGLGLSVSKKLLELMQGSLVVESELGKGSKFLIDLTLPLDGKEVLEDSSSVMSAVHSCPKKGCHILLVEDDSLIQFVHQHKLEKLGCRVTTAMDGKSALEQCEKSQFDVIFMDIGLPDMSGNDTIRKLREIEKNSGKHTRIVVLTAYVDDENHQQSMDAGADEILCKPVEDQNLQEVFEKLDVC